MPSVPRTSVLGWVVIHGLHRSLGIGSAETFALPIAAMLALAWLLNRYVEETLTPRIRTRLSRPSTGPLPEAA
ncbi:hypothetical protein [Streptomyces sp. NPDC050388]|uniref:hypothetical protein n=1 Tax=Streptomyces sp. NPDC050388 TaxID=3155781 RepID=UPI00341EB8AC